MVKTSADDLIERRGAAATVNHRTTEYYGNPVVSVGDGGTFAAGVYYWRANPIVSSVEYGCAREVGATLTLNQTATLTLPSLGAGVTFNVYRSAAGSRTFGATSLLASGQAAGAYTDTGGALGAGTPTKASSGPYIVYTATVTKYLYKDFRTPDAKVLEEGIGPLEKIILYFKSTDTIDVGDTVTIGGFEYTVIFLDYHPRIASTSRRVYVQRRRGEI